mgnify:CR=1 FL=1
MNKAGLTGKDKEVKKRILLADDHTMMRDGLRLVIEKQPDMQVVGECRDGHETVRACAKLSPHLIVMDIAMPGLNGIEATRQVTGTAQNTKVIALSAHSDRRFITEALKAGASGYLLKHSASEELIQAIRAVTSGRTYLSPEITGTIVNEYKRIAPNDDGSAFSQLSEREREVLQLLTEGKTRKEAADILHLSVKTIGTHAEHIMEKLNTHSLPELTKYAIREGLTSLEE